jgi:hypothetical protein
MSAGAEIGLVHIVYAPYGPVPLRQFVESYQRHPAGTGHELLLVFKGFEADALSEEYHPVLDGLAHRALFIPDGGFDLGSYIQAARTCEHRLMCCLNSRSVILADGWLENLRAALETPGIGLVGATGTLESTTHNIRRFPPSGGSRPWRFARRLYWRCRLARAALDFPDFPNAHLRTNAFMIGRQRLLELQAGPFRCKEDCYRFESGRRSLTRQILARGLDVRVVGRDGGAYPVEGWRESGTFRVGEQRNLLVADNQTREYLAADADKRRWLTYFAWGE